MNRIILIGNGFDLAHGMKTSYKDFIGDFWTKMIEDIRVNRTHDPYLNTYAFENEFLKIERLPQGGYQQLNYEKLKEICREHNSDFTIKNIFLKSVSDKSYIQNWVDIENEYYELLKKIMNDPIPPVKRDEESYLIKQLNSDFEAVKLLLSRYLKEQDKKYQLNPLIEIFYHISYIIYSQISVRDLSLSSLMKIPADDLIQIKGQLETKPNKILFLNFNYTSTAELYAGPNRSNQHEYNPNIIDTNTLHIHGSLKEFYKNPIIFGYGDELDDNYTQIEKLNDNEYLENIKSVKYLETRNYRNLLEFIESDQYQIFIMGHSCGTSDRTLLNTLFEHENCAAIKPFYHKRKDGSDNYSDIVRNITRNFNSKIKLRSRVINKIDCQPLIDF